MNLNLLMTCLMSASGISKIKLKDYLLKNCLEYGQVGSGIGGYPYGTFWINQDFFAGAHHFDTDNSIIFVIISNDNKNAIAYTNWDDNPWTSGYNYRPLDIWINGKSVYPGSTILTDFKNTFRDNYIIDYAWESVSGESISLQNCTYYKIRAKDGITLKMLSTIV